MGTPLRPLHRLEQYLSARTELGIYLNVAVTALYERSKADSSIKNMLFSALSTTVPKHPSLCAIPIDTDTSSPYFVRLQKIRLEEAVSFIQAPILPQDISSDETTICSTLDLIIQDQHNRTFQHSTPPKPFWRIVVVDDDGQDESQIAIIFVFHHCLADTQSALVFHADLEAALSSSTDQPLASTVILPPAIDLLPPLEALHPLPQSSWYLGSIQQASKLFRTWTGAPQTLPVKTHLCSFHLSPTQTSTLLRLSKVQSTSLTATLQALIASSLFSLLPDTWMALYAECAVSLRRFLPSPIDGKSMGCYAGAFGMVYTRAAFSWDEARHTKRVIDGIMTSRGADTSLGSIGGIENMLEWFKKKLEMGRMTSFELSNVGLFTGHAGQHGDWMIRRMLFSQSASACGGVIKVSVVTGGDSCLGLAFTWQEGVVEEDLVMNLVQEVKRGLLRLCQG